MKQILFSVISMLFFTSLAFAGILTEAPTVKVTTRKVESAPASIRKIDSIKTQSNVKVEEKKGLPKERQALDETNVTMDKEKDRAMLKSENSGLVETKNPQDQTVRYMDTDEGYYGPKVHTNTESSTTIDQRMSALEKKMSALEQRINEMSKAEQPPVSGAPAQPITRNSQAPSWPAQPTSDDTN